MNTEKQSLDAFIDEFLDFSDTPGTGPAVVSNLPTDSAALSAVLVRGARGANETNRDRARTNKVAIFRRPNYNSALGLSCWKNTRGNVVISHPENPLRRGLSVVETLRLGFIPVAGLRLKVPVKGFRLEMSMEEVQQLLELASNRQTAERESFEQGREALLKVSTFTLPETLDEEEPESEPRLSRQFAYVIGQRVCELPPGELTLEQIGFAIRALSTEPGGLKLLRENVPALRQISTCICAAHKRARQIEDPLRRLEIFVERLVMGTRPAESEVSL